MRIKGLAFLRGLVIILVLFGIGLSLIIEKPILKLRDKNTK